MKLDWPAYLRHVQPNRHQACLVSRFTNFYFIPPKGQLQPTAWFIEVKKAEDVSYYCSLIGQTKAT